jgi:hypothetical protein
MSGHFGKDGNLTKTVVGYWCQRMISAKRMLEIFRRRGGHEFASLSERLTPAQFAYLEQMSKGKPIIAMMYSEEEWFAVTKSQFVFRRANRVRTVHLDEIYWASISESDFRTVDGLRKLNRHIKKDGGDLQIKLRNGTSFQVRVEPGGPYFGLMNVLMRVGRANQSRSARAGTAYPPTTDDQRPAAQS